MIRKAIPFLKYAIKDMVNCDVFNNRFMVVDLGCSSGTNTVLVVLNIIDVVQEVCQENNHKVSQFQVCLNELFGNDSILFSNHYLTFIQRLRRAKEKVSVLVLYRLI